MIQFEHRTTIKAPVDAVFAVLSDPSKIPRWRRDIPKVTGFSPPLRPGSTFEEEVHFMGTKRLLMEATVIEPSRRLVLTGLSGMPLLPTQAFTLSPHADGTDLELRVEMQVSGLWRLLAPLLPGMLKKIWVGYFKDLEHLLIQG